MTTLIFACGTALFSDGYANGVISSVNTLLTRIYGTNQLTAHNYRTTLSALVFAGTVVGMIVFGYLSDKVGRKFGMMSATGIVALFSLLSAGSAGANGSVGGLLTMLAITRFFLGIGVGAEYPCGSVAASEQSEEGTIKKTTQNRWFALATNSMIDFGFVISALVPLILYYLFGPTRLLLILRLSLGLGALPALAVLLWRLRMPVEPERYRRDAMKTVRVPYALVGRRYGRRLAVISATWFLYDFIAYVVFSALPDLLYKPETSLSSPTSYPFGIYSTTIINSITGGSINLNVVFGWNVVINLFYMPGTIGGAFIVDRLGPRNTMILGLLLQALTGFIMSALYTTLKNHIAAFAVVYGVFLTFGELGPGNCLGLLAAKSSATAVRGQFYGLAAAVGKVGAFAGTWAFPAIIKAFGGEDSVRGNTGPFWVASALAILSALLTAFVRSPTPDGMAEEDAKFRRYLEENGWDTARMGVGGGDGEGNAGVWKEAEGGEVTEKEV